MCNIEQLTQVNYIANVRIVVQCRGVIKFKVLLILILLNLASKSILAHSWIFQGFH